MVVRATKWYKCDLQVATPGWDFKGQAPTDDPTERAAFCGTYMERLAAKGIEVIALADHHGAGWLQEMQTAGKHAGITVFPGVEISTGSGADGIHLVAIGDLSRTERDIEVLLRTACGFGDDHPPFIPGTRQPAASPRSIGDILDQIGDGWFTIAVHALSHSGIAGTAKGTVRWTALHHDRLNALDPGRPGTEAKKDSGFNAAFRTRNLDDFPGLRELAFISTSDGYDLDAIGRRFTWIRMAEPSLEGLRQAALDHRSRIICDSDERLQSLKEHDPNNVGHAWIESIRIDGTIGNSTTPIEVPFNPRLNVIIGGRGAGKSTIVAGLRHLYSDTQNLPESIRAESQRFADQVFKQSTISSTHRLAYSREQQRAEWTSAEGPLSERGGRRVRTAFPVRVFSQKELFELTTNTSNDPQAASRYLLKLVDTELHLEESSTDFPSGRAAARREAAAACVTAVAQRQSREAALERLPGVRARHSELRRQVGAFGDPASQTERASWEEVLRVHIEFGSQTRRLNEALSAALTDIEGHINPALTPIPDMPETARQHFDQLTLIRDNALERVRDAVKRSQAELTDAHEQQKNGTWASKAAQAESAILAFQNSLDELGIDASQYLALREEMSTTEAAIAKLTAQAAELDAWLERENAAWMRLDRLDASIRDERRVFLERIGATSRTLRFKVLARSNVTGWIDAVRTQLNLRSNAFVDEVPEVGHWLWTTEVPEQDRAQRLALWRAALSESDFTALRTAGICRSDWWSRLSRADQAVRVGLATFVADDTVEMSFLRDGGDTTNDADWQLVTTGSPGQRTAAMLGFVLNHGDEPLVLDQPEDDLDAALITSLIVNEVRRIRWDRQVIIVTHNANIPVIGDAESVIVMASNGRSIGPKTSEVEGRGRVIHIGPIEVDYVRSDIQEILEGGQAAFKARERRYQNDLSKYHEAMNEMRLRNESARGF